MWKWLAISSAWCHSNDKLMYEANSSMMLFGPESSLKEKRYCKSTATRLHFIVILHQKKAVKCRLHALPSPRTRADS